MKKRIVSMILALSMMLSILPVSAFADAGAGFSSAAAEETNSITYSSEEEHEAVGKNSETNNQVVKIKIGTDGLPKAAAGTGWSFDETAGLTITGTGSEDTEYVLDGTVSCNVTVKNANRYTVYLLDGTVTGTLLIEADNMYGVYVLDGSYADVQLNLGTIDGGTYDKLTENGGNVRGGFFRDISGLSTDTQQQAHQLLLPEGCTLNGQKETGDIYIVKKYDYFGTGKNLDLVVESDTPCEGWAVATTSSNGGVMTLPAGVTDYNFTYNGNVIAKISISEDGRTLSASFSMIPMSDEAPMKLVTIPSMSKELSFTDEGLPDLTDVACVESLDEGEHKLQAYLCRNWTYACYPNMLNSRGILTMADQGGREIDFKELSHAPINCAVQLTNATITDAAFGEKGALLLTSGKITGGIYPDASVGISTTDGTGKVEITGGVFDSLSCYGECTISNAVILDCMFSTFFDNSKFAVSDTVFGERPDALEGALAAGQQISKLVVRNGNVTAINGRSLTLSTNTIYLVGKASAEITMDTDVLSINEAEVSSYNSNTSATGKVLRITGNNDGADILVNKSTDVGAVKPLRITEDGLPDLTGVEPKKVTGEGMEITLYEGQGWKYGIMSGKDEDSKLPVTMSMILITSPDGNPVDLTSREINPSQAALKSDSITLQDVTVTSMYAGAPVELDNAVIESGYFQKEVTLNATSTIAGGVFDATVKLRDKAKITAGVFHDIKLPDDASKAVVIENAVILGSLTGNHSKAAVSDTVSLNRIDSAYLAAGQQQSELRSMDGVMTDVNGNSVADVAAVYRIGDAGMVLTFTKPVTNINGKPVSAYNGAQLSPDGKTLYLNGRNDGADIVVNQTGETTGKLPFSSLKVSNFKFEETMEGLIITCDQEGVGELSIVCVRTDNNAELDHIPSRTEYGSYKVYIEATEGERYTAGRVLVAEEPVVRKYRPTIGNFSLDLDAGTATYTGPKYYGNAVPKADLVYNTTNDDSTATATVPTEAGTYYVWLAVEYDDYYDGSRDYVDSYTVAEKLPFEGFTQDDFDINANEDGTYTLVCKTADGVGELSTKIECLTGVNKGKTFINREPDEDLYGRYQGSIVAKEGKKYKAGSIVVVEDSLRYTPEAKDFTYDAAKNTVKYTGTNYYDADPDMTLLYGTDQSETAPTAPGRYDVYVKVTAGKNYIANAHAEDDYRIYQVGTYVVPEKYTLTVDDKVEEHAAGEKLSFTADEKDGFTFTGWEVEGVPEGTDTTKATITFKMPANNVTLKPQYKKNSYTLTVDGKDEQRDFDEDVTVAAPEKEGFTFSYWEAEGVPEGTDTTKATITFKMPANNVTLKPQYKKNTYTLTVDGVDEPRVFDENVTVTAPEKEGFTFTGWEVEGVPEGTDTTSETISFKMPANNVTLKAQYTENAPKTYKLDVSDATITLKDGSDVTDLTAVPVGTELVATAPEKDGYTFTGWEVDGVPEGTDTTKATISFKMPANNVTLKPQYEKNTYTLTVDGVDEPRVFDENVTVTAPEKDGYTFTGWEVTGLPADVDTTKATISFKMPANNVTLKAQYTENAPKTYKLDVSDATITLKDGSDVTDLTAVPVGTELVATAPEKDGYTFTGWEVTGLPADVDTTKATISFKMPANNVTLKAQYTENAPKTYKLDVSDATITLKDGSDVTDLTAVPVGTELVATAPEKDGYTFTGWEVTGLPADVDTTKATISFKMPANNVTLKPQYEKNTYTLTVNGKPEQRTFGEEVTLTARKPEGMTFSYWEIKKGLAADAVDVHSEKITFTMPANDVTISAIYVKDPTPDPDPEIKTHELKVSSAQIFLKDGSDVADLTAVPVGTELKAIAYADTETEVFKCWTGLELTEEQSTARVVYFTMPDHDVNLMAVFVTPAKPEPKTYKVSVSNAKITLKDGSDVADLKAVPAGTQLVATADDDTETSVFKSWSCTGLELTEEQSTARVLEFTMPDHDVNLTAAFVTPAKPEPKTYKVSVSNAKITLKDGSAVADLTAVPVGTQLVATADEDTETSVFKSWSCTGLELTEEQRTARVVEFTMPDHDVELTAVFEVPATPDPDPAPAPSDDGGGAVIVAVAAVGGAAIGVGAYIAGTTAYLKSVLPEGMAIPANRQQLAVALWTAAGKPATQSTALFNDVAADAAELQAIRWVVETGLMTAQDGNFKPGSRVGRMEVIRTWKAYQQRG